MGDFGEIASADANIRNRNGGFRNRGFYFLGLVAEEVLEAVVVEAGKAMAVVNGIAYNKEGGEGEMVVADNLGEIFQLTAIYALVFPRQLITSGYRSLWRILHQQFPLHVLHNGGTQIDAHSASRLRKLMQLLTFRHRCAPLASGQDNRLNLLRNGELRTQGCCCRLKR